MVSAETVGIKAFMEQYQPKRYTGTWLFVFWPFEKICFFPRGQQELDFPKQQIRTASGKINNTKYSRVTIETDPVMYFNWPIKEGEEEKLIMAIKEAPHPDNKEELLQYFGPSVMASVRRSLGNLTWVECDRGTTEDGKTLSECVIDDLRKNTGNPVFMAKLQNVRFEFKNFTLPEELNEAITLPQVEEYKSTARKIAAKAIREERKQEGLGDAAARKAIGNAINNIDDGVIIETLHTLREMAQGTSNTILYGLPPQVANILKEKTGFEPSEKDMGKFAAMLIKELERRGKI